ncbi:MAG: LCP family protein [Clostridia bacterium]|nr:LCP family protein [Clostridia bacterium]
MPLYFRDRRPLSKRAQYLIAFAVLTMVLIALTGWLTVRYYSSHPDKDPQTDSSQTSSVSYTDEDDGTLLLIFSDSDAERFMLIHTAPSDGAVFVAPLPANTLTQQEKTLADVFRKNGPAKAMQAVAAVTNLPVSRYMALTTDQAESFLADLGEGVSYTLPEAVRFTDKDGATMQLDAGEQILSAGQTAALLRYEEWKKTDVLRVNGDIIVALLNRYLLPTRSLRGDFASLSNLAKTNLRIDDYTTYRDALIYLAEANALAPICQRIEIVGKTDEQGRFIPDVTAIRQSPLTP